MSIKIIKPGMFTTIQDPGRNGHRADGIGPSGAMDFFAASIANFLVGNDEDCPVLEMHFPSTELLFEEDAVISITGADFNPFIDDVAASLWQPWFIKKNQTLCFKKYGDGARAYLSVQRGIQADKWLNSYSTHTKVAAGGYNGRPLSKGDNLQIKPGTSFFPENVAAIVNDVLKFYSPPGIIRCITGPEWNWMDRNSKATFSAEAFSITAHSDRMGYRLHGTGLGQDEKVQLVSSPVDAGTLQLLPNGQLIILMADHQTTGGYPRIANVITADLPKLAQKAIHSKLRFRLIALQTAEDELLSLYQALQSIKNICKHPYEAYRHQL